MAPLSLSSLIRLVIFVWKTCFYEKNKILQRQVLVPIHRMGELKDWGVTRAGKLQSKFNFWNEILLKIQIGKQSKLFDFLKMFEILLTFPMSIFSFSLNENYEKCFFSKKFSSLTRETAGEDPLHPPCARCARNARCARDILYISYNMILLFSRKKKIRDLCMFLNKILHFKFHFCCVEKMKPEVEKLGPFQGLPFKGAEIYGLGCLLPDESGN